MDSSGKKKVNLSVSSQGGQRVSITGGKGGGKTRTEHEKKIGSKGWVTKNRPKRGREQNCPNENLSRRRETVNSDGEHGGGENSESQIP